MSEIDRPCSATQQPLQKASATQQNEQQQVSDSGRTDTSDSSSVRQENLCCRLDTLTKRLDSLSLEIRQALQVFSSSATQNHVDGHGSGGAPQPDALGEPGVHHNVLRQDSKSSAAPSIEHRQSEPDLRLRGGCGDTCCGLMSRPRLMYGPTSPPGPQPVLINNYGTYRVPPGAPRPPRAHIPTPPYPWKPNTRGRYIIQ